MNVYVYLNVFILKQNSLLLGIFVTVVWLPQYEIIVISSLIAAPTKEVELSMLNMP